MAGESGEIIVTSQDEQFNDHTLVVHGDGITVDNVPLVKKSYVDSSISTNNPAFVSAVRSIMPTTLRAYDPVRQCWWKIHPVNGVLTLTVED